jgi:hypothetical protein
MVRSHTMPANLLFHNISMKLIGWDSTYKPVKIPNTDTCNGGIANIVRKVTYYVSLIAIQIAYFGREIPWSVLVPICWQNIFLFFNIFVLPGQIDTAINSKYLFTSKVKRVEIGDKSIDKFIY